MVGYFTIRAEVGPFFIGLTFMPRIIIDGTPIGCPVAHGEGNCPMCGGGWPGTDVPSKKLVGLARRGQLKPELMPCGTLGIQAEFLLEYFSGASALAIAEDIPYEADVSRQDVSPERAQEIHDGLVEMLEKLNRL